MNVPDAALRMCVCREGPAATEDWAAAQGAHPATDIMPDTDLERLAGEGAYEEGLAVWVY